MHQMKTMPSRVVQAFLGKKSAIGQCYPWATRFARDKDGAEVVHGTIVGPDRQGRIRPLEHAWVEWNGKVYDWQTVEMMKKSPMSISEWRREKQACEEYRLTDEEASLCELRSRHHGPWTEAERAFVLERRGKSARVQRIQMKREASARLRIAWREQG